MIDTSRKDHKVTSVGNRNRWGVLAICCLALLVVGLDNTIVNVALPAIGKDLNTPPSGLAWVIDAYTVVLASLLILSGTTGDRFGRKRVFQIGLAIFGIASLLCGLSVNSTMLILCRMLQAVGGSMLNPVAISIIRDVFHDKKERATAMGFWGATFGLGIALGPLIGGFLVQYVGWRSIFNVNVPIIIVAIILTQIFTPESRASVVRRVDVWGQILTIILFGSLVLGIIEGPAAGFTSPQTLITFAVALIALILLIVVELRTPEPLIDMTLFRSKPLDGAVVTAIVAYVCLGAFLFINTLYLQQQRELPPSEAGMKTLPFAIAVMVFSIASGFMVGKFGARVPTILGGIGITVTGIMLLVLSPDTPFWYLYIAYFIFGFGFGLLNAPITNTAVSGLPKSQSGLAGGIASTSRQLGQSLGVAIAGAIVSAAAHAPAGQQVPISAASHLAWIVMICGGVLVLVIACTLTPSIPGE